MWETALLILFGAGTLGFFGALGGRELLKTWKDAATSCGLQAVETSSAWYPRLTARTGPIEVRIRTLGVNRTQIVIEAPGPPGFQWVSIHPEPVIQPAEITIGDKHFDDAFFVGGPPRAAFALLDAEMRRLLLCASSHGKLEISRGEIRLVRMSAESVPLALPLLLDIGRRYAQPMDISRRLAENARQDSVPRVRLRILLLLLREPRNHPSTVEAQRAAGQLAAEARGVLLQLAGSLEDDEVSAQAMSALKLKRELPFEFVNAILDHALRRRCILTARACLEALVQSKGAAVDKLAKVLEREHGELALTAAWALGATGSPAAEPPLIQALRREDSNLRKAAVDALGRVGTLAAVLPLKEAGEGSRLDRELHHFTRKAIAEIQGRFHVPGSSRGQLSLAGTEAGQLSLAADPAGQLSLPPAEPGRLSLSADRPDAAPGSDEER